MFCYGTLGADSVELGSVAPQRQDVPKVKPFPQTLSGPWFCRCVRGMAASVLAVSLHIPLSAVAGPLPSVQHNAWCAIESSPQWSRAWFVPPSLALEPAEAVKDFVHRMLLRLGWAMPPAPALAACSAVHAHAPDPGILTDPEDASSHGVEDLLLARCAQAWHGHHGASNPWLAFGGHGSLGREGAAIGVLAQNP
jgi:hypothetical protein